MAEQSASDYFTIAVEGYGSNLLHNLNKARLDKRYCDCKVQVGKQIIYAHKVVLAEGCDYFKAKLPHPTEPNEGLVEIEDVDFECLEICVKYIYLGKVEVLKKKLVSLLQVASRLQLKELCSAAEKNLTINLSLESFFTTKNLATSLSLEKLGKLCDEFALKNLTRIAVQEDFVNIDLAYLKFLLTAEVSAAVKVKIFLLWAKHDTENRGKDFEEFFTSLDLDGFLSYVNYLVENEPLFYNSADCLRKVARSRVQSVPCEDVDLRTFQEEKRLTGFAVFDKTSNAIHAYDPDQASWAELHKVPSEIRTAKKSLEFTATVVGEDIFVLSKDRRNWKIRYSDRNASWTSLPNRSITQKVKAVAVNGHVYAVDEANKNSKAVELYDGISWSHVTDKPLAGYETHVVAVEDSIYCMGGYTDKDYYSQCNKYETGKKCWTSVPPMPEKRSCGGVAELERKIYVIGGYNKSATATGIVYDIGTQQWAYIAKMHATRSGFQAVVASGKIYSVGSGDPTNTVEEFDPATGKWRTVLTLTGKSIISGASIPICLQ